MREVAGRIGRTPDRLRLQTGSVGAFESTVQVEVEDLRELHGAWAQLETVLEHKKWSRALEPHVMSGTPRWEIFRIVE